MRGVGFRKWKPGLGVRPRGGRLREGVVFGTILSICSSSVLEAPHVRSASWNSFRLQPVGPELRHHASGTRGHPGSSVHDRLSLQPPEDQWRLSENLREGTGSNEGAPCENRSCSKSRLHRSEERRV